MAQAATMGPPLSPRETRRSGRRSAPSVSASASKSPDSDQPPRDKGSSSRVTSSSSANSRSKRLKQEEYEETIEDRKNFSAGPPASSGSTNGNNNNSNKAKRKTNTKEKDKQSNGTTLGDAEVASADGQPHEAPDEEEEQGITRCVCGSAEDDPDAGEFMVQCETCKVWQHGLCMGYQSEDQVHDDDYYCELCRPELHTELLKKLAKKPRQTSATSRQDPATNSRVSRSHSPSHLLKQPSKRRNTMNSRDAAFDESLKEIIEATAAEAAAVQDTTANANETNIPQPEATDIVKKKRKRTDDDVNTKKRTRSASTASERQIGTTPPLDPPPIEKPAPPVSKPAAGRNKRGGRKVATIEAVAIESEEGLSTSGKRPGNNQRAKVSSALKRPPLSQSVSQGSGAAGHEHGTRRNQSAGGQQIGTSAADARAYRNSHAYAVSQQTLFTSWNLPDYLSHLEAMLPTDTPQPLEVRSGGTGVPPGSRGESVERTMERGVKVRWPAKRMSVGDMNKRVRALVEWVGREQGSLGERKRRREALEIVLREQLAEESCLHEVQMAVDDSNPPAAAKSPIEGHLMPESALQNSAQTMKQMEELMEELITFQERFGPGAKSRDRERRLAGS